MKCMICSALCLLAVVGAPTNADNSPRGQNQAQARSSAGLSSLTGEWTGTVEVSQDGRTNASIASASVKRSADGASLVGVFEGFCKGKAFEGVMRINVSNGDGLASLSSYDSRTNSRVHCVGTPGENNSFVFEGEARHVSKGNSAAVRQVIRMAGENRCVIEWFSVDDGREHLSMRLTLDRTNNQLADAQRLHQDAALLDRVGAVSGAVRTAAVETE